VPIDVDHLIRMAKVRIVSAKEVIAEIDALPPAERKLVLEHIYKVTEAEIPEAFRRSIADALSGKGVDMEVALSQVPPSRR
jgi:hypothetical protein